MQAISNSAFFAALALVASAAPAFAQGPGGQAPGPITAGPANAPAVITLQTSAAAFETLELGVPDPIEIRYDASAGPIAKVFTIDLDIDGSGLLDSLDLGALLGAPSLATVVERFVVGPDSPSLGDWHEEILTPGLAWGAAELRVDGVPSGVVSGGAGQPVVWFDFPPAGPGSIIEIEKQLLLLSTDPLTPIFGTGETAIDVAVREYPTIPEPATATLLVLAAASRGRRGRRGLQRFRSGGSRSVDRRG